MPELSGPLDKLVKNEHLRSACDLFTNLLALSRDAYFTAFKDYVAHLLPIFRRIHSSVAMFIDNIDEYFEDFLASDLIDTEEQRAVYRSYWHFAQVGIALAARDLHAINNHVKIFVSIRKEVFQRTFLGNPLGLQLAGSALDLQYAREDLVEIIRKNIEVERKRALVDPTPGIRGCASSGRTPPDRPPEHRRRGGRGRVLDPPHHWPAARHHVHRPRPRGDRPAPPDARDGPCPDHAQCGGDRAGIHHRDVAPSRAVRPRDPVPADPPERHSAGGAGRTVRAVRPAVLRETGGSEPIACHVFASMFKIGLLGYVGMHPETAELVQYFRTRARCRSTVTTSCRRPSSS